MELEHELFVCGTHALAFYLSPRAKRLDKAFEERVSRGLPAGQLPNFISYADQPLSRPAACAMPLHSCTPVVSNAEARELRAFFGSTLPLNVMVPAKGERRNSSRMCCWIHPAAVPRENYLHLAKGLFIASPELAAMQVCPFYSEVDTIVLMSMLCSFYVENPQAAGGLEPRRAPCTPESFGIFLAQMDPSTPIPNGRSRLMRCLRSAVSNAASPAELQLALALSLPKRLGGFALPKPMLNCSVQTQEGTPARASLPATEAARISSRVRASRSLRRRARICATHTQWRGLGGCSQTSWENPPSTQAHESVWNAQSRTRTSSGHLITSASFGSSALHSGRQTRQAPLGKAYPVA